MTNKSLEIGHVTHPDLRANKQQLIKLENSGYSVIVRWLNNEIKTYINLHTYFVNSNPHRYGRESNQQQWNEKDYTAGRHYITAIDVKLAHK